MKKFITTYRFEIGIAALLVIVGMASRLLPHPANMTAVGASSLFAGAVLPRKWGAVFSVIVMIATDLIIGLHTLFLFTWGSMALYAGIGLAVKRTMEPTWIILGAAAGALQFFLITNWAVWQFTPMYPHTAQGLAACFIAALPFARNMLIGDILFASALFGVYAIARQWKHRVLSKLTSI